jgi:predicted SAM-dependent methyltransferase
MKLIIGAGKRQTEGFIHHDAVALPGIDIVCDFWDLPTKVKPESCEEIHATHVLEHFPMARVDEMFRLLHSLLKPGGKLYIEVPNFQWHAEEILKNPKNRQIIRYAFGGQKDKYDFHYNGFTPDILFEDLTNNGFIVDSLSPYSSIECWARKL